MAVMELNLAELDAAIERRVLEQTFEEQAEAWSKDFRKFVKMAWPLLEPATPYSGNWHIDAICEHLQACINGEFKRLIINIPPRHMKSLLVSVFWPAWLWTSRPSLKFLVASYGQDIAVRDADKMRSLVKEPWYTDRWSIKMRPSRDATLAFENTRRGGRISTTVGGSGTGQGGDIVIIDDPLKATEAFSVAARNEVKTWHDSTIARAFNNLDTGIEVVIMQRLHEDDLTGHLLGRSQWHHLCLPARFEPSHPFVWPDDPRTVEGELLWPAHINEKNLLDLAEEMNFHTAGQLQQRPAAMEGEILKRAWWRFYKNEWDLEKKDADGTFPNVAHLPHFEQIAISWDLALRDGEHNDYAAGQVWGIHKADRYLLKAVQEKMNLHKAKTEIKDLHRWTEERWPRTPIRVLIEKAAAGPQAIEELKREIPGIVPIDPRDGGKKERRAMAAAVPLESHNVFVRGTHMPDSAEGYKAGKEVQSLIEECAAFPFGSYDDQVDAFSQAMNWARGRAVRARVSVNMEQIGQIGAIPSGGGWRP